MATTYLHRTPSSTFAGTKYTFSGWFKRGDLTARNCMLWASSDGGSADYTEIEFKADNTLHWANKANGGTAGNLITTRLFRDPAAWYHLVFAWDTTASAADRMRIYVNGVEETSFGTDTNPGSGDTGCSLATSGDEVDIGRQASTYFYNGVMAHLHLCMGNAYAASDFGETDATSGIWIAKSGPSVTYGDDGFFLKFASGALGTDSSGEGNNFTVSGTMTNTKDTPDNNFATLNPLENYYPNATFTQGNNTIETDNQAPSIGTVGLTSGKWYCEGKCIAASADDHYMIGISSNQATATTNEIGHWSDDYGYKGSGGYIRTGNSDTAYGDSYTTGDIIGIALDLTNNKLYFAKNNTWQDSGVPTSGGTGTGAISITAAADTPLGAYFMAAGANSASEEYTWSMNFGNGYFGTTAVTSAEADGAGIGAFEYAPPTGYYALCTNNLGDQS